MEYRVIYSSRRTLALEMMPDGQIVVRAPRGTDDARIDALVREREDWILCARARQKNRADAQTELSEGELYARASRELPPRLAAWAERMGVTPTGVRITRAKKRLGSCSADNHICLSANLMRWPEQVIDYVLVHELAHIRHKHHGPAFYVEIARFMPDYREALAILRGCAE